MDNANYSKPTQREIDRAETDLLLTISTLTGRKFAELADCHETKISRTDWRFIAKVFCIARMAAEVSPIGRAMQDFYRAVGKQKAPAARTAEASQITMVF